ncbi:MAG: FecR domain-containing protein [Rhizobiaceae bacterium]|nr:FecR domain-containing protein [Rhizobiaceae bacterium]
MTGDRNEALRDEQLRERARDWLVRLSSRQVSDAELSDFKAWIDCSDAHRRAFELERDFWRNLEALAPSVAQKRRTPVLLRRRSFLGAAAAAAVGAFAYPRVSMLLNADFRTSPGEQKLVQLPDGSTAFLNTDTAISLNFGDSFRIVRLLQGEAQFTANAAAPQAFRVASQHGFSETGDASFAVMAADDMTTVTVLSGDVRVAAPARVDAPDVEGGMIAVESNQQTSYSDDRSPSTPIKVDPETELAWRRGRLVYTARPFGRAVRDVARYMPERVILATSAHNNVPVSAAFSTHDPLSALQALATTQGLAVHRIPGVAVVIS